MKRWFPLARRNRPGPLFPVVAALLVACSSTPYDVSKPHITADGFRNPWPHDSHGFSDFLAWRWDRLMGRYPERPENPGFHLPVAENDPAYLRANRTDTTITWVGHATLLVQMNGVNVLTDPHFTRRASPVDWAGPARLVRPGLALEELPPIDVVTVSHNHYDHLDVETVRALANREQAGGPPRFFVPLGLKAWFAETGIDNVVELDWWDRREHAGLTVTAVPAQHFSSRTPFDRNETLWAGWVLESPDFRFYHAGDTGYAPHFREIGRRLGPLHLAALPIGAYEPRWFMKAMHLNPADAVQAHRDLGAVRSVGMHWGTFDLTDELPTTPPQALAEAREAQDVPPERFFVMDHGETRVLQPGTDRWTPLLARE